ncbi:MAG TPA: SDR family oxidoreductase [Gemmataceae bacterium]|nr:SDR family oxidoreductase [Gemmataceae bacterium]
MAKCLVTGGAGFIGSHLVEALVARGHQVRVLDNFNTGDLKNLKPVIEKIEWIEGDITNLEIVRKAVQGMEFIFHQAALASVPLSVADPVTTHQINATGTLHVLMAANDAQVKRVIYAGSCNAYGNTASMPIRENHPTLPPSPYAVAKLAGEEYCIAFHNIYNLETVRLRYFNIFGPRQRPGGPYFAVIPIFIQAMIEGRKPVIFGDGQQSRDFTYVADVVQANLLAMEAPRVAGRVYNIATGRRTTLMEILENLNGLMGMQIKPVHDKLRPGDVRHSQADISLAQMELGFCPCTDLPQNLGQCIEYYSSPANGHIKTSCLDSANIAATR